MCAVFEFLRADGEQEVVSEEEVVGCRKVAPGGLFVVRRNAKARNEARARALHLTSPIVAAPATLNGGHHPTPY